MSASKRAVSPTCCLFSPRINHRLFWYLRAFILQWLPKYRCKYCFLHQKHLLRSHGDLAAPCLRTACGSPLFSFQGWSSPDLVHRLLGQKAAVLGSENTLAPHLPPHPQEGTRVRRGGALTHFDSAVFSGRSYLLQNIRSDLLRATHLPNRVRPESDLIWAFAKWCSEMVSPVRTRVLQETIDFDTRLSLTLVSAPVDDLIL